MIMSVDFYKAFDTIEWDALCVVMNKMNFGERFVDLVRVCYQDTVTAVQNNGHISQFFPVN